MELTADLADVGGSEPTTGGASESELGTMFFLCAFDAGVANSKPDGRPNTGGLAIVIALAALMTDG